MFLSADSQTLKEMFNVFKFLGEMGEMGTRCAEIAVFPWHASRVSFTIQNDSFWIVHWTQEWGDCNTEWLKVWKRKMKDTTSMQTFEKST